MQVVRAEGRVARREVDLHLLGVAAAAWGCCLWSRRPARLVRSLLLTQSSGAVRHVWEAPKRGTRCTRIVWIYEQVWALIAIAGGAVTPQKPRNAIILLTLATCKTLNFLKLSLNFSKERAGGEPRGRHTGFYVRHSASAAALLDSKKKSGSAHRLEA